MTFERAYGATRPAEVDFRGTVAGSPRFFFGTHTRCEHEEFGVQTASGPVDVIDNVDIAPRVPVCAGDPVEVKGVMVHDPGRTEPVVHWTHHDPQGTHAGGFIRFQGKDYA